MNLPADRLLLFGATGNDYLIGGVGSAQDTFLFRANFGRDTIADFTVGNMDRIKFEGIDDIENFTDLVENHLGEEQGTARIFSSEGTLTLLGYTMADIGVGQAIDADSFLFF